MKTRKEMLLQELEDIQLQLIDIQYRLDASKRKPVPTIPIIYPEERHQDPFHVRLISRIGYWEITACLRISHWYITAGEKRAY